MAERPIAVLARAAATAATAALALGLLLYVAWGDGRRTWAGFVAETMAAQGALVQAPLEAFLREGLPLGQFPGFAGLAEAILAADPGLSGIAATDAAGTDVFVAGAAPPPVAAGPEAQAMARVVARRDGALVVALPLRSRYETVGALTLATPLAVVEEPIAGKARDFIAGAVGAALGLAATAAGLGAARRRTAGAIFAAGYGLVAVGVVVALAQLYAEGAERRAQALAETLAQRLAPIYAFGLTLEDVDGLDALFAAYRALNPDILAAGLVAGGVVVAHDDPAALGAVWSPGPGAYDFAAAVPAAPGAAVLAAVALPSEVVWRAVARSAKNFAALFLAAALVAAFAFGAARGGVDAAATRRARLGPLFFAAVAAESLAAGFLPQLVREAAAAGGWPPSAAPAAFTAYFAAFTAALAAGGVWCARSGPRWCAAVGAALAAAGALGPALAQDFATLAGGRLVSGLGQGLLLIAVQSAALTEAGPGQRARAAVLIVFGFNGGMLTGAAVGALLVTDLGPSGVFAAAAGLALAVAAGACVALAGAPRAARRARRPASSALAEPGFLRALLLIGAPAKAVLTGVAGFAMPLTLADRGWAAEDIGQAIMLYGAGVLAASGPVAAWVDRSGRAETALALGALGSAVALALIGLDAGPQGPLARLAPELALGPAQAAIGALLLGLSHGFVNAPVVAFVAARAADPASTAARYRVAERSGHVAGPLLIGHLVFLAGDPGRGVAMAGLGVAALAAAFLLAGLGRRT